MTTKEERAKLRERFDRLEKSIDAMIKAFDDVAYLSATRDVRDAHRNAASTVWGDFFYLRAATTKTYD